MPQKENTRQGGVSISGRDINIKGDVVGRDKITRTGPEAESLAGKFREIHLLIDKRPDDPNVDKDELKETVNKIEQEAAKGPAANEKKVERWLTFLASMADDIFDVTVSTLTSPVLGISKAIQLIAKRARSEYAKAQGS